MAFCGVHTYAGFCAKKDLRPDMYKLKHTFQFIEENLGDKF